MAGELVDELEEARFYLDEAVLRRMECNDPSVFHVWIEDGAVVELEGVGQVIGDSTVLRTLDLDIRLDAESDRQRDSHWYEELFRGLSRNRSIESICLSVINWNLDFVQTLIPFFEYNSNLNKLAFFPRELDDECLAILSHALTVKNNTLTLLSFHGNDIVDLTITDWSTFSLALSHPMCILEHLYLRNNVLELGDEAVTLLGEALVVNKTLKSLNLGDSNHSITLTGWQGFSRCLGQSTTIEELYIGNCGIDDDRASAIVNGLIGTSSLKMMDMSSNPSITTAGWELIINILLNGVHSLDSIEGDFDGEIDWAVLSSALCDDSSIVATFSSNHTFREICNSSGDMSVLIPDAVSSLFLINRSEKDTHAVARNKILNYHFPDAGETNIQAFSCMSLASMPFAIEWIGRGGTELSLMYNVVRLLPILFDVMSHESTCSDES